MKLARCTPWVYRANRNYRMTYPTHKDFLKSLGPDDPYYGKRQRISGRQPTPDELEQRRRRSKENNDMRYPSSKEQAKDPKLKLVYRSTDPYGEYVPERLIDDIYGPLV